MAKPPSIVVLLNNHDNVVNIERELVRANGSVRIDALKNKFLKKDFKIKNIHLTVTNCDCSSSSRCLRAASIFSAMSFACCCRC